MDLVERKFRRFYEIGEFIMLKINFGHGFATAFLLSAISLPGAAFAADQDRASAAIAVAKGKIQTGDSLGATDQAGDIQARARAALETAQHEQSKNHQDRAFRAAENASALAEYAIAAAELKTLTTQRDQLAAR
jgi:hypothetical protein